jgi:NADH-quinone oxidoreductase subunit M
LRFAIPFFPNASAWAAPAIGILAVIGIIYAGIIAFAQHDLKLVLSYATISHLGFVILGIFSGTVEGVSGALVTMINSGLTTGALFLMVGILARSRGSRQVGDFGGVWLSAPKFGSLALVTVFASIGVPGLNGFIGEYLALQGTWLSANLGFGYAAFAVLGVIISAAYLLHMYRTVFMGATPEGHAVAEANRGDLIVMTVLVLAMLVIGMYPTVVLGPMQASVADLVSSVTVAPLP